MSKILNDFSNCNDRSEIIVDADIDNSSGGTSQTDTFDQTLTEEDNTDFELPTDATDGTSQTDPLDQTLAERPTKLTYCSTDTDGDDTDDDVDNPAKGVIDGKCFMETSKIVQLLISSEMGLTKYQVGKKNLFTLL